MRKMLLCVQRNISAMSCLHMEREIDVKHRFLLLNTCLTAMLEQYTLYVVMNGCVPANRVYWIYRRIVFKTQKHFWLGLRSNYAACVAGIWSSVLSKAVTYSWNEPLFFIDIMFHISQC